MKTTIKELNSLEPNFMIGITRASSVPFKDIVDFANLLGDKQWIHIDKEKCQKESPYRAPIVHGYLILGLIPNIVNQLLEVVNAKARINYGINNARFPQALKVDEKFKVRLNFLTSFNKSDYSGTKFKVTFESISRVKPYCVAELLYLWVKQNTKKDDYKTDSFHRLKKMQKKH